MNIDHVHEHIKKTQIIMKSYEIEPVITVLKHSLNANSVLVVDTKGKVLTKSGDHPMNSIGIEGIGNSDKLPSQLNKAVLDIDEPQELLGSQESSIYMTPIVGAGKRLGSLLLVIPRANLSKDRIIILEITAILLGMLMSLKPVILHNKNHMSAAIKSLSYSEIRALQLVFDKLDGDEGIIVTSKIADRHSITRSTFVSALRKMSSAMVLESRSLGMKGTYIRILIPEICDELERHQPSA